MKRLSFVAWVCLFVSPFRVSAASPVVISEFMANNTRTLADEDGDFPDWIEIRNNSASVVNLQNWSLTDNAGNRTKWRFPATNFNVGAYMVVFASGKDRHVAGGPLHTSFKLDKDGGYLALVDPDGQTIASQFNYPPQVPNVSFGIGLVSSNVTLLSTGAAARVLVPAVANGGNLLGEAWKGGTEPFNDSSWSDAVTGIGFSSGSSAALVGAANLVVRFNFDAAPVGNVIVDSKPSGTPHNGVNNSAIWLPAAADTSATPISRSGVMQFVVPLNQQPTQQITLAANADFNSMQGTIMFWMRSLGATGPGDGPATLMDRTLITSPPNSFATGGNIVQNLDGTVSLVATTNGNSAVTVTSSGSASDDRWHHIAVTYNQNAGGSAAIYLDGVLSGSRTNARAWGWLATQQIELGRSHTNAFRRFNGLLDDFRIYTRVLTDQELAQIYAGDGGVAPIDLASNLESTMLNVNPSAFIRLPFAVADTNAFSLLTLRMKYDDGFAAWINGQLVAAANVRDPLSLLYNEAATASHSSSLADAIPIGNPANFLRTGQNILAIQGLNRTAGDGTFLVLPELLGASTVGETVNPVFLVQPTPGAANAGGQATLGPVITEVQHSPNVPLDFEDLQVMARVTPAFAGISNVTLRYTVMFNPEISVSMSDGGTNGDRVAGDGIWSGIIPSTASTNGQMIRYYISARDQAGTTSRWPLFNNPTNSEQYLGTIVDPTNLVSKLPIFHVFFPPAQSNAAGTESGTRCSFFYDGEFYDNVRIELRGNTSAGFDKKAYRLEFNRDHKLRHPGPGGRIADTSLLGEWADPGYFRQAFSFWLLDAFGTPSPFDYPVRLQLNADFFMLVLHNDVMGEEQLARMGYDTRGALYKAAGQVVPSEASTGVFQKRTRLFEDHSDYQALANGISETQNAATRATNLFDMLDVPQVINYLVCARWTTEADDVWANMTLYRDSEGDKLWRIIPFDMNVSWGQLYCGDSPGNFNVIVSTNDNYKSHPLYGGQTVLPTTGGANWNRIYDVIVRTPATREMLLRRMRSLMDTILQSPDTHPLALNLERKFSAFTNSIWTEAFLDRQKWSWPICSGARGPYCWGCDKWLTNHIPDTINQYIVPRRRHWFVTHSITNTARAIGIFNTNNAGIPLSQPTNALISVAGLDYSPVSGNQDEEYLCLTNGNPIALDISGWKLGGGVDFTFKAGTVIPSNGVVYVSPNTLAFRNRAVAPHGGMALFVVGPYRGQLSARGEPLTITDTGGRLVYTNTYVGNPTLAQQFLRITEIMYNPSPLPGNTNDAQEFEYVELKNISASTTLDLNGVHFSNGIGFAFTGSAVTSLAPGQRVLVVKNPTLFALRYGGGLPVAGAYAGSLENNGERIQLLDADNEEILDFSYNNSWYPITDGAGFSLVIVDENAEPDLWDSKTNWRPSGVVNGMPGQPDAALPTLAPIVVNEVLTHTDPPLLDTVELFNPTTSAVNLGGWYLTDDFGTPRKYRIPANTIIGAGGYVTFDEGQFNTPSNAPTSFAFSSKGDEVYLFSGDGTNLTGYVQGYAFGAAENGVTFGRYTNSQTNVQFVAQSARTLGAANAGPKVGPVVISEIMYHPPDRPGGVDNSEDEYIELQNITSAPVPLFNPLSPTDTWRLRGGVDFELPPNVTLAANHFLLLVNFNPASPDNAARLLLFRGRYGVPGDVPIFGPYRGKLNNSSDDVKLERPDTPEASEVPYLLVDRVEYQDQAPWPTGADGIGAALQRVNTSQYGNDPINWTAGAPTAGAGFGAGSVPAILAQPANQVGLASQTATFNVMASGTGPLHYQWRFNGANLDQATGPTLTLRDLQLEQSGRYSVAVFNAAGIVLSSEATLNVLLPAYFTSQPQSVNLRGSTNTADYGFTTNSASFSVGAIGNGLVRYQWRFNQVAIPGSTGPTLTVNNVGLANDGNYDCVVTDDIGSIASASARLKVLIAPVFLQVPLPQAVVTNGSFTASVVIRGNPPPFRYEWREISSGRGTNITSETTNYFSFGPVTNLASRTWRLVVFNDANPAPGALATFNVVALPDSDGDGIPDDWETAFGFNPASNADRDLDSDSDGVSNWAEYFAGTDPTNRLSFLKIDAISLGGGATLTFGAISNKTYTLQYTDHLGDGAWAKLVDLVARVTNHVEAILDPSFRTNRYYRVVTPQQP